MTTGEVMLTFTEISSFKASIEGVYFPTEGEASRAGCDMMLGSHMAHLWRDKALRSSSINQKGACTL